MKQIIEFVIRLVNLLEAEGRAAKENALSVARATMVFAAAVIAALVAVVILVVAIYFGLVEVMHRAAAAAVVGVVLLALALLGFVMGQLLLHRRSIGGR